MKKYECGSMILMIFLGLILCNNGYAQERFSITGAAEDLTIDLITAPFSCQSTLTINGFWYDDTVLVDEAYHNLWFDDSEKRISTTNQIGAPALPILYFPVQLPTTGGCQVNITITDSMVVSDFVDFDFNIIPTQPLLMDTVEVAEFIKNEELYALNSFFPDVPEEIGDILICSSLRKTTVFICPFHWNPVTKQLVVYHQMEISIHPGGEGENPLINPPPLTRDMDLLYDQIVINYTREEREEVPMYGKMGIFTPYPSDSPWLNNLIAGFRRHKLMRGIQISVYPILAGWPQSLVYNTIHQAVLNDTVRYVLLIGGAEAIPLYTETIEYNGMPHEYLSDVFYAMHFGADRYPDIAVGRFSNDLDTSYTHIEQFTTYFNKAMAYENTTNSTNVALVAHRETNRFREPQLEVFNMIQDYSVWSADTIFGHYPEISNQTIISSLESITSCGFWSYRGHSIWHALTYWCHPEGYGVQSFEISHMYNLANENLPIILAFGCSNAPIHLSTMTLGEHACVNSHGGGVSYLGSTVNTGTAASNYYNHFLMQGLCHQDLYRSLPNWGMLHLYAQAQMFNLGFNVSRSILKYIYLGDPSLFLWHQEDPEALEISYVDNFFCNGYSEPITVQVAGSGIGRPDAIVTLILEPDSLIFQQETDPYGWATFQFPEADGHYLLTAFAPNHQVGETAFTVGPEKVNDLQINYADDQIFLTWSRLSQDCFDGEIFYRIEISAQPYSGEWTLFVAGLPWQQNMYSFYLTPGELPASYYRVIGYTE